MRAVVAVERVVAQAMEELVEDKVVVVAVVVAVELLPVQEARMAQDMEVGVAKEVVPDMVLVVMLEEAEVEVVVEEVVDPALEVLVMEAEKEVVLAVAMVLEEPVLVGMEVVEGVEEEGEQVMPGEHLVVDLAVEEELVGVLLLVDMLEAAAVALAAAVEGPMVAVEGPMAVVLVAGKVVAMAVATFLEDALTRSLHAKRKAFSCQINNCKNKINMVKKRLVNLLIFCIEARCIC